MKQLALGLALLVTLSATAQAQTLGIAQAGMTAGQLQPNFTYFDGPFALSTAATASQICVYSDMDTVPIQIGIFPVVNGVIGGVIVSATGPLGGNPAVWEDKCLSIAPTALAVGSYAIGLAPSVLFDVYQGTGTGVWVGCASCSASLASSGNGATPNNLQYAAFVTTGTSTPPITTPPSAMPSPSLGPNLFQFAGPTVAATMTVTLSGVTMSPDPWQGPRGQEILAMQALGNLAVTDTALAAILNQFNFKVTDANGALIFPKP